MMTIEDHTKIHAGRDILANVSLANCPRLVGGLVTLQSGSFGGWGGSGSTILDFYEEQCRSIISTDPSGSATLEPYNPDSGGVAWVNLGSGINGNMSNPAPNPTSPSGYVDDVFKSPSVPSAPGTGSVGGKTGMTSCDGSAPSEPFGSGGAVIYGNYLYLYDPVGSSCSEVYLARISLDASKRCVPYDKNGLAPPWACAQNYEYFNGLDANGNGTWTSAGVNPSTGNILTSSSFPGPDDADLQGGSGGTFTVSKVIGSTGNTEFIMMYEPKSGNFGGEVIFRVAKTPWGLFDQELGNPNFILEAGAAIPGCGLTSFSSSYLSCRAYALHPELDPSDHSRLVVSYFQNSAWGESVSSTLKHYAAESPGRVQFADIQMSCIDQRNPVPACPYSSPLGYLVAHANGQVDPEGTAYYGSAIGVSLHSPIVGISDTPDSKGYWLVASDGGIFNFGDATFFGSMGGIHLNQPIVGMASTPDGKGYWLVASDGGIFTFGDAPFFGSTAGKSLAAPIAGMSVTPSGGGYWLVARDGGIFTFGDTQYRGSPSVPAGDEVVGMTSANDNVGYWEVSSQGAVYAEGDAVLYGVPVPGGSPVVGIARQYLVAF